ncbi:MAG TPA: hypothetical protein VGC13_05315 [Longimicrobium sp.]|uniref:hypothetical protein n=1 Tax=Longimicrobium sp. TaxID=2029185 RepID=UPI002ED7E483
MSRELLSLVLLLLAVFGVLALVSRLGRELTRLALNAAEATAATGLAEVSERRGDITGLMERRAAAQTLRRNRRRTLAGVAAFLLLLAIPPFAGLAREVYAACALLWFVPARRLRPRMPVQAPEQP